MASSETAAAPRTATDAPPETTLRLVRVFDAPREAVFAAWTVPEHLVQWWGPESFTVPEHKIEVREGGGWWTRMRSPDGVDHVVSGTFREIRAPERLVMTWGWETDGVRGHETLITLDLRDLGGRTELTLTQETFESAESCTGHGEGWKSSFVSLDQHLAKD